MKTLLIKLIIVNALAVLSEIILFVISGDNITQIIATLCSLAGLIISIKVKNKVEKVIPAVGLLETKVSDYHKEVDGKMTDLVAAVKGRGEAEGKLQQAQDAKDSAAIEAQNPIELKAEKIIVTTDQSTVKAQNVTVTKENDDAKDSQTKK